MSVAAHNVLDGWTEEQLKEKVMEKVNAGQSQLYDVAYNSTSHLADLNNLANRVHMRQRKQSVSP